MKVAKKKYLLEELLNIMQHLAASSRCPKNKT
jgi:hypothetical protein